MSFVGTAWAIAPQHLYFVQLSTDRPGYGKPDDDRSEHKQFIFAVEGENFEAMLDALYRLLKEARKDTTGMLAAVTELDIDWIVKASDVGPGLLHESSITTEANGASALMRSNKGVFGWTAEDGGSTFVDFTEDDDEPE